MFAALERSVLPGLKAFKMPALAGMALCGLVAGVVVAVAGLNALYLSVSLIACGFVLADFRIGLVLLILLLPISSSQLFPHAMFGITGLNPLNLLLIGTLCACLLRGLSGGRLQQFLPRPLLWLYVVPILIAGGIGVRHVGDIASSFGIVPDLVNFTGATGYLIERVAKPLSLVVFALLVGAAASASEKPERLLIPMVVSIWAIGLIVVAFVAQSGIALSELASSASRAFLSPLGLHANDQGRLYTMAYALLLFTWAESKQPGTRLALLASMGLVITVLVLTFSRGAFVGFILVNVLFLLWRRNMKALVFFMLLAMIALFALPAAVFDRIATGEGEGLNIISAGRINGLWLPLLPEVMRSPIYGSGLGSIMWSEPMRLRGGADVILSTHPHSAYLQALLDMGTIGLILLCAYFVHVWRGFRALSRDMALSPLLRGFYQGAAAGLLGMLVSSVTDGSLLPRPEQAFLWLAIGMMYGQQHKRSSR
jgi:hypothetical protein